MIYIVCATAVLVALIVLKVLKDQAALTEKALKLAGEIAQESREEREAQAQIQAEEARELRNWLSEKLKPVYISVPDIDPVALDDDARYQTNKLSKDELADITDEQLGQDTDLPEWAL